MTRIELLRLLVRQARDNGFEFRRWYTRRLELPWTTTLAAVERLAVERHYYALLFSHEFAQAFWKPGEKITFLVPSSQFQRVLPNGSITTVNRKSFTRRSARADAWQYHLSQLALSEEPLRYMRRFLRIEEDVDKEA